MSSDNLKILNICIKMYIFTLQRPNKLLKTVIKTDEIKTDIIDIH